MLAFNHTALFVSNLAESTRFYTELLGFSVVTSYPMPNDGRITYLRGDGGQIELVNNPGVARPTEPPKLGPAAGMRHIAFKTDDLDGLAARLQEAGVRFRTLPRVAGSGNGRLMFFYDPDFIEIEVIQRDTDW
ncbi:MAG: VOC family protein [Chloroflexota bacterium]